MTVAIVGAGPAGAALALLLARRGVARRAGRAAHRLRARVPRRGAAARRRRRAPADGARRRARRAAPVPRRPHPALPGAPAPAHAGHPRAHRGHRRPALRLAARAARDAGRRGRPVIPASASSAASPCATCCARARGSPACAATRRAGAREIAADYVIGTDGRASLVRRRSGLDREREAQSFDVVWFKVPLPDFLSSRQDARAYLGRGHFCLMFPAPDGLLQIGWVIEKGGFGELRERGIDEWLSQLAHARVRRISRDTSRSAATRWSIRSCSTSSAITSTSGRRRACCCSATPRTRCRRSARRASTSRCAMRWWRRTTWAPACWPAESPRRSTPPRAQVDCGAPARGEDDPAPPAGAAARALPAHAGEPPAAGQRAAAAGENRRSPVCYFVRLSVASPWGPPR